MKYALLSILQVGLVCVVGALVAILVDMIREKK